MAPGRWPQTAAPPCVSGLPARPVPLVPFLWRVPHEGLWYTADQRPLQREEPQELT